MLGTHFFLIIQTHEIQKTVAIMMHLGKYYTFFATIIFAMMATKTSSAQQEAEQQYHADHFLRREEESNAQHHQHHHRELLNPCRGEKFVPCDPGMGESGFQICRPMGRDGETAQFNICATPGIGDAIGFTLRPTDYCGCCYAICPDTSACTCPCTNNLGEDGIRMVEKVKVENFPNRDLSFCATGSAELEGVKMSLAQKLINLGASPYQCVPADDLVRCPTTDER
jgi:hypothetical protein